MQSYWDRFIVHLTKGQFHVLRKKLSRTKSELKNSGENIDAGSVPPKVSSEDFIELMEALMDGEETAPAEKHTCNCNRCTFTAR